MSAARAEMADAQAAISEGSQIVVANVSARWQFIPGQ
jgi:hypothetical protein